MEGLREGVVGAWRAMQTARPLVLCATNRVTPLRVVRVGGGQAWLARITEAGCSLGG